MHGATTKITLFVASVHTFHAVAMLWVNICLMEQLLKTQHKILGFYFVCHKRIRLSRPSDMLTSRMWVSIIRVW